MILKLGQRWLTGSGITLSSGFHEGKWFFRAFGEYLLTLRSRDRHAASTPRPGLRGHHAPAIQADATGFRVDDASYPHRAACR
jgi:hypothetical protein